jgi:hypothetical protein
MCGYGCDKAGGSSGSDAAWTPDVAVQTQNGHTELERGMKDCCKLLI